MNAKTFLFLLIALTLVAEVAAAESFDVNVTTQKDRIYQDEVAFFTVSVTNKESTADVFTVTTPEFDWVLDSVGSLNEINPGDTESTLVELTPTESVAPGARAVRIKVRSSNTREFENIPVVVSVLSSEGVVRQYTPSIFLRVDLPENVDPREPLMLSVYLRNRNARTYNNDLTVRIESDLFTKEYTTSLGMIGEEGEKTNQVPIVLDKYTEPGQHSLRVTLLVNGTIVNTYETQFQISAFDDTSTTTSVEESFFKKTTTYTVENAGNIRQEVDVNHPTNLLKRLFTSSNADYKAKSLPEGSALVFTVNLEPKQQAEITVTENYRLLFILAVLVGLSIISYFLFRSPVVLRKEAIIYGSSADGVSMLKIRLFIKNRTGKSLHNLHAIDRVTSMADVVKENALGTLHPTKIIRKKGHGTLVRWDIDTLEPFEERIITYQVRTQLKLIGDVYLPAMKVKFDQKGRERTTYSNEVNIPREG